ncbi:MAG: gliding motility-associated C-terminal domain-containing protein, partial [Cyclobacteriaceae bacterium]
MRALMRKRYIGLLILFNFATYAFVLAQKQGYVWYFPRELGLNFNTTPPTVLLDGRIDARGTEGGTEGCGSIASANGELLFYANAKYIWNRKHEIMRNGDGLMGDVSSTNGAVIVPMPGENAKYYVFTTDGFQYEEPVQVGYSIVDMCGDGGYGEVIPDSKNTVLMENAGEKLAVTQHANGVDYWLVAHKQFSNAFYAYLISATGISEPVVSEIGIVHGDPARNDDWDAIGQMKISPNGSKLALVMENRSPDVIEIFDFDNSSGILTKYKNLSDGTESGGIYGVAFSRDQSKLYTNGRFGLYQFSLDAGTGTQEDIKSSKFKLADTNYSTGGLQLGPDGKIYVTRGFHAGIIQNPNVQGAGCNFIDEAIDLHGRFLNFAFPTFIDNFNYPDKGSVPFGVYLDDVLNLCLGQSLDLREHSSGDNLSYLWEDGSTSPVYDFSTSGEYTVTISDRFCSVERNIIIPPPTDLLGADTTACEGDTVIVASKVSGASYHWENGSQEKSVPAYSSGMYRLTVAKDNCTVTDSIRVTYSPLPIFTLGTDTTLCERDTLILAVGVQADEYTWQDGSARSTHMVTAAGTYSATAILDGCPYSAEILVEYSGPTEISLGQDTVLCNGSALKLELDPTLTYYWSDGSHGSSKIINEPVDLWVKSLAGNCSSSDSVRVDFVNCELRLPNFFSPNRDQYNQKLIPSDMSGITSAQLSVYNRWGIELYHTDDFSILTGWDGTHQTETVSSGVYFW